MPNLRGEHEPIDLRQLPVELAEVEVFVERQVRGPELRGDGWRQKARDIRTPSAARHRDRRVEALAFIRHEEMHDVLDDRSTEGHAELLVLRIDLLPGVELGRRLRAEV